MIENDPLNRLSSHFSLIEWIDISLRQDVLPDLPRNVLLHAGPPLSELVPEPIRASAVQAILYEGLAHEASEARRLLTTGRVVLKAAQDHGVTTPLVHIVSASMPLAVLRGQSGQVRYAPFIEAGVPALRFGKAAPDVLARMRLMDVFVMAVLRPAVSSRPVSIAPLVDASLKGGEECHALTAIATRQLIEQLDLSHLDSLVPSTYGAFALPILMAASSIRLAESGESILAVGGNGCEFGVRLRDEHTWRTGPATPPIGSRLAGHESDEALGAVGDSAVIDFAGLGGQSLAACPALLDAWKTVLPASLDPVVNPDSGVVSLQRLHETGGSPIVNLAILDSQCASGLIGRGIYRPDRAVIRPLRPMDRSGHASPT